MRFRPFRSRTFWFGVPGLVFLLWAWGVSYRYQTMLEMGGLDSAGFMQVGGKVFAFHHFPGLPARRTPTFSHEALALEDILKVERGWSGYSKVGNRGFEAYSIPHYALVSAYVLVWAGLVAWRARKYRAVGLDAPADRNGP